MPASEAKADFGAPALGVRMKERTISEHFARFPQFEHADEVLAVGGRQQFASDPVRCLA
jgi:hypothetical protein